jgi:hypothetical protein
MKPDFLNDDELENNAPGLSKMKKENPFSVPENYFESLADNIQQKINSIPELERINKENPFQVPENYFESLPSAVREKIAGNKKKNIFEDWISISWNPKYAFAAAAIIIVVILGINYLNRNIPLNKSENFVTNEEIQSSAYLADLDESVLIEQLEEQSMNSQVNEDNSIEQYLIENNIDVSQIADHL